MPNISPPAEPGDYIPKDLPAGSLSVLRIQELNHGHPFARCKLMLGLVTLMMEVGDITQKEHELQCMN